MELPKPAILLVDDDRLFREAASLTLSDAGYRVHQAASPALAKQSLAALPRLVLIADICMEGNIRLEWLKALSDEHPELPVILCTAYPTLETALESIRLQVRAYLPKPIEAETLVREVGRVALSSNPEGRDEHLRARALSWSLTPREFDVLRAVATGAANKAIAMELNCSVRTVELHVSSLFRKSGLTSRAELIANLLRARAASR